MAERVARSHVNMQLETQPKVGVVASQARVTPQVASQYSGGFQDILTPVAGVFAEFFGKKAEEMVQKKIVEAKVQGQQDAQKAYARGDTKLDPSIAKDYSGPYADTYARALGSLNASTLRANFTAFATENQLTPDEIPAAQQKYFEENFGGGTGNLYYDSEVQNAWTTDSVNVNNKASIAAAQQVVKRTQTAAAQAVTGRAAAYPVVTADNFYGDVALLTAANRGAPTTEIYAKVLGIYQSQMSNTANGLRTFTAFLDAPVFKDPTTGNMLSFKQIPHLRQAVMDLESDALAAFNKHKTFEGQNAVAAFGQHVDAIRALATDGVSGVIDARSRLPVMAMALAGMPDASGISQSDIQKATDQYHKLLQEVSTASVNINKVQASINLGTPNLLDGVPEREKAMVYSDRVAKYDPNDPQFTVQFGSDLKHIIATNDGKIPDAYKEFITSTLSGSDPGRIISVLKSTQMSDPAGTRIAEVLKDDTRSAAIFAAYRANPGMTTGDLAVRMTPAYGSSLANAPADGIISGDPNKKPKPEQEAAFARAVAVATQGWFGRNNPFTAPPAFDPVVKDYALRLAQDEAALAAVRGETLSQSALATAVAKRLERVTYVIPGSNVVRMQSFSSEKMSRIFPQLSDKVYDVAAGTNVPTPWGQQNTIKNAYDAGQRVIDGPLRLVVDGDDLTGGDATLIPSDLYTGAYMLGTPQGYPLVIPVGTEIGVDPRKIIKEQADAVLRGNLLIRAEQAQSFTLTGNPVTDQPILSNVFPGSGVAVVPTSDGRGYFILAIPHATPGDGVTGDLSAQPLSQDAQERLDNQAARQQRWRRLATQKLNQRLGSLGNP